ncbi:hypothetical protein, partial [Clostridioides difficile]|uniref:hypothetical protein n=1 Tax=Clostridioides difficile TaxID=1496 RepID=UPI001A9A2D75
ECCVDYRDVHMVGRRQRQMWIREKLLEYFVIKIGVTQLLKLSNSNFYDLKLTRIIENDS